MVGWLREGEPGDDDGPLRRALGEAFPSRWPLHATEANSSGDGDRLRRAIRGVLGGRGWLLLARMQDDVRPDIAPLVGDPYPYALRALFARAALLFRTRAVRIHVRVADRAVAVRVGGSVAARGYIHHTFVHALARSAVEGLPTHATLLPVSARFRMDASTPAGLVVADSLANRAGSYLRRSTPLPLAALTERLREDFGIDVAVPGRAAPLPTLAADGPWDQAIRDRAAGLTLRPLQGMTWPDEQARLWMDEVAP
ncbi:MAG: hypothetical protein Q8P41_28565 [Pseudomonadota bacterium]|nr:hypothetical protein [Pseudomonadota bacterium]